MTDTIAVPRATLVEWSNQTLKIADGIDDLLEAQPDPPTVTATPLPPWWPHCGNEPVATRADVDKRIELRLRDFIETELGQHIADAIQTHCEVAHG